MGKRQTLSCHWLSAGPKLSVAFPNDGSYKQNIFVDFLL